MAAVTGVKSAHATLTSTTADTVTLTGAGKYMRVANRHATEALWFRDDGTTAVAAADENYFVAPTQSVVLGPSKFGGSMVVSVVGNGNTYSVELF